MESSEVKFLHGIVVKSRSSTRLLRSPVVIHECDRFGPDAGNRAEMVQVELIEGPLLAPLAVVILPALPQELSMKPGFCGKPGLSFDSV